MLLKWEKPIPNIKFEEDKLTLTYDDENDQEESEDEE